MSIFLFQPALDEQEITKLFYNGDPLDIRAALTNPSAKALLSRLYNRQKPFHALTDDQIVHYVYVSSANPCLLEDNSSRYGPDLHALGIQKGIWNLLETLPPTEWSMKAMLRLLLNINADQVFCPTEDPLPVLQRWTSVVSTEKPDRETNGFPSSYTGAGDRLDFIALAAALYGRYHIRAASGAYETINIGRADTSDILLRCAFYGKNLYDSVRTTAKIGSAKEATEHQSLLLNAMTEAYQRDGQSFIFAAMCNPQFFHNSNTRKFLENHSRGLMTGQRYQQRYLQTGRRDVNFDASPACEDSPRQLETESSPATQAEYREHLQALENSLEATRKDVIKLLRRAEWIMALIITIMIAIWLRT